MGQMAICRYDRRVARLPRQSARRQRRPLYLQRPNRRSDRTFPHTRTTPADFRRARPSKTIRLGRSSTRLELFNQPFSPTRTDYLPFRFSRCGKNAPTASQTPPFRPSRLPGIPSSRSRQTRSSLRQIDRIYRTRNRTSERVVSRSCPRRLTQAIYEAHVEVIHIITSKYLADELTKYLHKHE